MLFNSYIFLLLFFPLCLTGYFGLNHMRKYTWAQLFLLGMSLWFYGYFNPEYLAIMLLSIFLNYGFTKLIAITVKPAIRKAEMGIAVAINIGILFFFKYFDFFASNVNAVFRTQIPMLNLILPLGISFFTFQQISYIIDAYHGEVKRYPFLQYASFVTYFPQLIAGPIVTHDELIPQFLDIRKKRMNWDNLAQGLFMFILGMSKKVLIADTFGNAANWGFANISSLDTTNAIFSSLAYTIQIYFDFSGYCDMAIGIGRMMNIDLPVNFDSPYKALTITEFWQRWHKTLTRFFTKYIYIPLGGNRKGKARTYFNVMVVFLVSGLWHGANWTFILWGILHGIFNVVTRACSGFFKKLHPVANWLITFSFLNITWIIFRADSLQNAGMFIRQLLVMDFGPVRSELINALLLPELRFLMNYIPALSFLEFYPGIWLTILYGGAMLLILNVRNAKERMLDFRPNGINCFCMIILLVWCVLSLSGVSTFLYFNF